MKKNFAETKKERRPAAKNAVPAKNATRSLVRGALVAGLYVATMLLFQAISFGQFQVRVTEAMTVLPMLFAEAVPGLFLGCLLSNLLFQGLWFDVVFGSLATLIAAALTRRLREKPVLAALMPVVVNGLIVGPVVSIGYMGVTDPGVVAFTCLTVAVGEAIAVYVLGLPLYHGLRRVPGDFFR